MVARRRDAGDGWLGGGGKLVQRSFESFGKSSSSLRGATLEVPRLGTTATSVEIEGFPSSSRYRTQSSSIEGRGTDSEKARKKPPVHSVLFTRSSREMTSWGEGGEAQRKFRNFLVAKDATWPLTYLSVLRDAQNSIFISVTV